MFAADFKQASVASASASGSVPASEPAAVTTAKDPTSETEADVKAPLTSSAALSDSAQLSVAMPEVSLQSAPAANVNAGVSDADRSSAAVLEESMPTQRPGACKQVCVLWLCLLAMSCR